MAYLLLTPRLTKRFCNGILMENGLGTKGINTIETHSSKAHVAYQRAATLLGVG